MYELGLNEGNEKEEKKKKCELLVFGFPLKTLCKSLFATHITLLKCHRVFEYWEFYCKNLGIYSDYPFFFVFFCINNLYHFTTYYTRSVVNSQSVAFPLLIIY